ncbi:hypothetical protein BDY24DRAFT_438244 [Mrakia frigida]|uniref:uncharacterized protein n=1 Tax=Mrakia frigida TaxID=29902 RepID=UPI003FCC037F
MPALKIERQRFMTDIINPSLSSHSTRDDGSASTHLHRSHSDGSSPLVLGSDASTTNPGITKIHSANASWGKRTVWVILILLGCLIFIGSLENMSNPQFAFSASIFLDGYVFAAITPIYYAKFSDRVGRGEALSVAFVFYFLGLILMGSARHSPQVSAGDVLRYIGHAGVSVLPAILIADITTLRFRGLALSLTSLLPLINTFLWPPMVTGLGQTNTWRFGFFTFAIILPFFVLPIVALVVMAQRKWSKGEVVSSSSTSLAGRVAALDLLGLSILTVSVAFIIVAAYFGRISYGQKTSTSWDSPTVIVLLVLGLLLFPAFVLFELKWKKSPVSYARLFQSKIVLAILAVAFFQQFALLVSVDYQFMAHCELFCFHVSRASPQRLGSASAFYLRDALRMTSYGAAVVAGVTMLLTRRSSKWLLVAGLVVQLVGTGIMIRRGGAVDKAEFIVCQIIQGIGAGFAHLAIIVAAQASVIHVDVASITAFVFLLGFLGEYIGSSIGIEVWYKRLLSILGTQFPDKTTAELINEIRSWPYGSGYGYPSADPMADALKAAFKTVSVRLCIISTCLTIIPIAIAFFFVQTIELGSTQNAVDHQTLDGKTERVEETQV